MKTNKETINSIKNHLATLYSLKPDCKAKLDIMGTSQEMSDIGEFYDAGEDMTDWAQRIAHKDADGHYIYDPVTGKVESDIPWEERNWKKLGFDTQPTAISEAFDYSKGLIEEYTTAGKLPDNMYQKFMNYGEVLFFPDVEAMGISTANVTDWRQCFEGSSLTTIGETLTINLSVTDIRRMFLNCAALVKAPRMNISHITKVSGNTGEQNNGMFSGCFALTDATGIQGWRGDRYDMASAFYNCRHLVSIPELDCSNATTLYDAFTYCYMLPESEIAKVKNTANVTSLYQTFTYCHGLVNLDLSDWELDNITNLYGAFGRCDNLETITYPGDFTKVTSALQALIALPKLREIRLTSPNLTTSVGHLYNFLNSVTTSDHNIHCYLRQATYNAFTASQIQVLTDSKKYIFHAE